MAGLDCAVPASAGALDGLPTVFAESAERVAAGLTARMGCLALGFASPCFPGAPVAVRPFWSFLSFFLSRLPLSLVFIFVTSFHSWPDAYLRPDGEPSRVLLGTGSSLPDHPQSVHESLRGALLAGTQVDGVRESRSPAAAMMLYP